MSLPSYLDRLSLDPMKIDWSDHNTHTKEIITLNVAFIVVVALVTGLRLFVRLSVKKAAGLDDYLIAMAAICTIGLCSISIVGASFGLGIHIWNLGATDNFPLFLYNTKRITQALFAGCLTYATAITLTKCSIIASYLRIFPNQTFRHVMYGTGIVIILMWMCSVLVTILQCQPIESAWTWTIEGKCIDVLTFFYVSSSINLATDLLLWIAPLPLLWKLKLNPRQRISIILLFSFGFFACISSILRIAQLHGLHSTDITYDSVPALSWSVAEVTTGILCASIPAMRPLAAAVLPKAWLSTGSTSPASTPQRGINCNFSPVMRKTADDSDEWDRLGTSVNTSPEKREVLERNVDSEAWLARNDRVVGTTEKV